MESTIKELARFLNISENEAKQRVKNYHPNIMGEQFLNKPHATADDVKNFYKETDLYLYELIPWNHTSVFRERTEPLMHYRGKRILEIGAGTGSLCIALALAGNEVTYFDINETLTAFARQRFEDRLLPIKIVTNLTKCRSYDIVVAIDTLEHIHPDDLPGLLKNIHGCLKDGGFLYERSNWYQQDLFPMHYDHGSIIDRLAEDAGLVKRENGDYVKGERTSGVTVGIPILGDSHKAALTRCLMNLDVPPGTRLTTVEGHPVDLARNKLVEELNKDWLFFMDSDQIFAPDTLKRLLSWGMDIVAGCVFKRTEEPIPMFYKYVYSQDKGHYYQSMTMEVGEYLAKNLELLKDAKQAIVLPPYGLLEIDGCSAGCLLINKRVFDALEKPYFKCDEGMKVGEDFYFCRKAQEAGFKIYGDPSVLCGHFCEYERGHKHFMAWSMKEEFPWKDK